MILALLAGCWLERVTGEPVPLDPAFYEAVEMAQGQPGEGGGASVPFGLYEGEMVVIRGTITGGDPLLPVDLDVRVPDPTAPGGVDPKGKLLLEHPGPYELSVPVDLGALELQAFQDNTADGPTADDPFAGLELVVAAVDLEGVDLEMVEGARGGGGGGPEHVEVPPGGEAGGAPGEPPPGPPGEPPPAGGGEADPFAGAEGRRVTLRGELRWAGAGIIDLDLFRPDARSSGGRRPVGKLKRPPGPFEISVPEGYGPLVLEAFIDLDANGPGPGDPRGCYPGGSVTVGASDVDGLIIELAVSEDGKVETCGAPAPAVQPGAPPRPR